jgi:hypothetical protein
MIFQVAKSRLADSLVILPFYPLFQRQVGGGYILRGSREGS